MGYDMEMEEYHEEKEAFENSLDQDTNPEDYVDNPTDISGSVVNIHQNSPFLDSDKEGEPMFSGSRWTKVIKRN